jgi:hypothetical protein
MSKPVLEQALEALRRCTKFDQRDYDAMDALEEAVKQQGEPVGVAELLPGSSGGFTMVVFEANHVPIGTKLYTSAPTIPEVTSEMCGAGISAYEDAMDGDRLPDGDGYDEVVVTAIFNAMLSAAPKYKGDD